MLKAQTGFPADFGESNRLSVADRDRRREQVFDVGILADSQHVLPLLSVLGPRGTHPAAFPQSHELVHHLPAIRLIPAAQHAHGQAVMGRRVVGGKLNDLPQHSLCLAVLLLLQMNLADLIQGGWVLRILKENFFEGLQSKIQPVLILVDESHGKQGSGLPVIQAQRPPQKFLRFIHLLKVKASQPTIDNGGQEVFLDGQALSEFRQGLVVVELLEEGDANVVVINQAGFAGLGCEGLCRNRGTDEFRPAVKSIPGQPPNQAEEPQQIP